MKARFVFEELAPQILKAAYGGDNKFRVYINPPNLNMVNHGVRAVSDNKGNLYVVNTDDMIIHMDIIQWLHDNNYIKFIEGSEEKKFWNPYSIDDYENYPNLVIGWQRAGYSNEFFLAESYDYDEVENQIDVFNEMKKIVQKKNPQYKFNLEN